jgi:ankyrin repeat protein
MLHTAAAMGNMQLCERLLEAAGSSKVEFVRRCDYLNWPAVYSAISYGHLEVVKLVLQAAAVLTPLDIEGDGALHIAIQHAPVLKYLLLNISTLDVNVRNPISMMTPIFRAANMGFCDSVKVLLDHNADPDLRNDKGLNALHTAVVNGRLDVVRLLVQRGADVNALNTVVPPASPRAHNAVFWAVCNNMQTAMLQLLLELGADVRHSTAPAPGEPGGDTALHAVATNNNVRMAELLLAAGADVGAQVAYGANCIHGAAREGSSEVLALLLQHAPPAVVNELAYTCGCEGCSKLTALMSSSKPAIVKQLLAAGADVHKRTSTGRTCLHVAAMHSYSAPVLCLLIKAGVDVRAVDSNRHTAAEIARRLGNKLAEALLSRVACQQSK